MLPEWLPDQYLQAIATENNHSETAFLLRTGDEFELRWFTPAVEVDLCGHATLASAYIIFNYLKWAGDEVRFKTLKSGVLSVKRRGDLLEMDLPARPPFEIDNPAGLAEALGEKPLGVWGSTEDLLVLFEKESVIKALKPEFDLLKRSEWRGFIVTARGDQGDFVSRFFAPRLGIDEDPVTGSAHCVLTPFWAKRLNKKKLHAFQVSSRGGEVYCEDRGERVGISGRACLYLEGQISI
jgi:PhzF family phenazine biosynthesis protein